VLKVPVIVFRLTDSMDGMDKTIAANFEILAKHGIIAAVDGK
jgi:hypothetical protein